GDGPPEGGMESRRPGEGVAPRAVRGEEARSLPQDLRGRRIQDLDPRSAGDQAEEDETAGDARSGRRSRRGAGRGDEEAGTAEVRREAAGRRSPGEVRTASRPRRGTACVWSVAVQGLRGRRRHVPRMRRAAPEGGGARGA